jgi:hypothetical protein
MRTFLSLIALASLALPMAASAKSIVALENDTHVAASFKDGTIEARISNAYPLVAPDKTSYVQSVIQGQRLNNFLANQKHCSVFSAFTNTDNNCSVSWSGL